MTGPATFSLFVRDLPRDRGFSVAAGLTNCLDPLQDCRFEPEELAYPGQGLGLSAADVEALSRLRFTGDVRAVPEGRVVFAAEPLLEVTAPLPEAQLVETMLLNFVTFATAVATKAARCRLAAPHAELVDFSARRAHGCDAALAAARLTAIAGFGRTSNVEGSARYGLRAAGTVAHSYIQAFRPERDAFRAFVEGFPAAPVLLVDTYDPVKGIARAIEVGDDGPGHCAFARQRGHPEPHGEDRQHPEHDRFRGDRPCPGGRPGGDQAEAAGDAADCDEAACLYGGGERRRARTVVIAICVPSTACTANTGRNRSAMTVMAQPRKPTVRPTLYRTARRRAAGQSCVPRKIRAVSRCRRARRRHWPLRTPPRCPAADSSRATSGRGAHRVTMAHACALARGRTSPGPRELRLPPVPGARRHGGAHVCRAVTR
ncbi:hypothetical protein [Amycolatopsis sp. FDAARGOS 1241]|uniref:hypothetical protein n=1 Tax=Amycolatopsis sp. FDAARGOS 1241 TaxID=2778070 RepID=UPI001EF21692|nr:hypothetical protein [Amycolatopsis sp. FDAARGOS 1241]